ncbi:copper resistance protein CopC [Klebsiella pneumoniae]|uniref:copper resistance protein CopC n=1 Tax=Klebsiella pneumoniae TaxID=573 RepID=UPI0021D9A884|nr:copper resistance protein CopC [Klebsiella pneumoniae]UYA09089.1 copper resistance protein CopC [Klebsiella pneumoniae]
MGEISVKTGNNARNGGKNSLNRLIRCVCGKKIGPDPRNFNQRVSLGRNDLLIRTFPKQLALSFTESLEPSFSKAELKNADGHIIPAGKPALDPKDKATLIVPVSTTLDKGQYEVDWTALSVDGHKTQGKYTFTVK